MTERDEIARAARISGDSWLDYMATYSEAAMTPDAWSLALNTSRQIVLDFGEATA